MTTTKTTTLRHCTGSARFGIEPHEVPIAEFPKQPSRKDGLGTMCAEHWKAYVQGLTADRKARATALMTDAGDAVPLPPTAAKSIDAALARADRKTKATRERTPAKPPANADEVAAAKALIAEVETLSGEAYTQRLGEDDVQRALETVAAANGHREAAPEAPTGATIDAGTDEADTPNAA